MYETGEETLREAETEEGGLKEPYSPSAASHGGFPGFVCYGKGEAAHMEQNPDRMIFYDVKYLIC